MQRVLDALAALPSVGEVEVSEDATWRPADAPACRWFSVAEAPETIAAAAAAALGQAAGVKRADGSAADALGVGSSSEEEDEEEEMRQAARAVKRVTGQVGADGVGFQVLL